MSGPTCVDADYRSEPVQSERARVKCSTHVEAGRLGPGLQVDDGYWRPWPLRVGFLLREPCGVLETGVQQSGLCSVVQNASACQWVLVGVAVITGERENARDNDCCAKGFCCRCFLPPYSRCSLSWNGNASLAPPQGPRLGLLCGILHATLCVNEESVSGGLA